MLAREFGGALRLLKNSSKHHKIWQMAMAIAMGLVLGLVPKTNLLAVSIFAMILLLPVHTLLAIMVSVLVSGFSSQLDPVTHRLGMWLLEHPKLEQLWLSMATMPMMPWFDLHNTVVLGGLTIGAVAFYPAFVLAYSLLNIVESRDKRLHEARRQARILPLQSTLASSETRISRQSRSSSTEAACITLPDTSMAMTNESAELDKAQIIPHWHVTGPAPIRVAVTQLSEPTAAHASRPSSENSQMTAMDFAAGADADTLGHQSTRNVYVANLDSSGSGKSILASVTSESTTESASLGSRDDTGTASVLHSLTTSDITQPGIQRFEALKTASVGEGDEPWLIETTIEVVRMAEEAVAKKRSEPPPVGRDPMPTMARQAEATEAKSARWGEGSRRPYETASNSHSSNPVEADGGGNREEALRYLLRHLREIKERN